MPQHRPNDSILALLKWHSLKKCFPLKSSSKYKCKVEADANRREKEKEQEGERENTLDEQNASFSLLCCRCQHHPIARLTSNNKPTTVFHFSFEKKNVGSLCLHLQDSFVSDILWWLVLGFILYVTTSTSSKYTEFHDRNCDTTIKICWPHLNVFVYDTIFILVAFYIHLTIIAFSLK